MDEAITRDRALSLLRKKVSIVVENKKARVQIEYKDGSYVLSEGQGTYAAPESALNRAEILLGRKHKTYSRLDGQAEVRGDLPVTVLPPAAPQSLFVDMVEGDGPPVETSITMRADPEPEAQRVASGVRDSTRQMLYEGDRVSYRTPDGYEFFGHVERFHALWYIVLSETQVTRLYAGISGWLRKVEDEQTTKGTEEAAGGAA